MLYDKSESANRTRRELSGQERLARRVEIYGGARRGLFALVPTPRLRKLRISMHFSKAIPELSDVVSRLDRDG
jgi:hypothetical protein